MSPTKQSGVPIPEEWRKAVVDALESGDPTRIQREGYARRGWESTFPHAWPYQWDQAMIDALSVSLSGRPLIDMEPPCEGYAFFFVFEETRMYGEIGLLPNGKVIIVFSSHKPRKGDSL